jgi:hypothetical protein
MFFWDFRENHGIMALDPRPGPRQGPPGAQGQGKKEAFSYIRENYGVTAQDPRPGPRQGPPGAQGQGKKEVSQANAFRIFAKTTVSRPKSPVQEPGRALQEHRARVRKQLAGKCFFVFSQKLRCHGPRPPSRSPAGPSRSTGPG